MTIKTLHGSLCSEHKIRFEYTLFRYVQSNSGSQFVTSAKKTYNNCYAFRTRQNKLSTISFPAAAVEIRPITLMTANYKRDPNSNDLPHPLPSAARPQRYSFLETVPCSGGPRYLYPVTKSVHGREIRDQNGCFSVISHCAVDI